MTCSIARTLDVIGERWTPLIIRDLSLGISRFDTLQRNLSISRKVLAQRLTRLLELEVIQRSPYQENPVRYDYTLTAKGADLAMILLAMKTWGDRWVFGETGPPLAFRHDTCGATTDATLNCSHCGEVLSPANLTPVLGPGYTPGPGTSEIPAAVARLNGSGV
jgi:DNA-binding HxlR family transcriptional regulator